MEIVVSSLDIAKQEPCTSAAKSVRWQCDAVTARSVLRLLKGDKKKVFDDVARFYSIHNKRIILRLRVDDNIVEDCDRAWEIRVDTLLKKYLELERLLWNLSTLGGAYSAMGDYDQSFADEAVLISMRQLRIAAELGDPSLTARCHLYVALAVAQRGHCDEADKIVRLVYRWARANKASLLSKCCEGVNVKLRTIRLLGTPALKSV